MYLRQQNRYRIQLTRRETLLKIFGDLKQNFKSLEVIPHFDCFYFVRRIQEYPLKHVQFVGLSNNPLKEVEGYNNSHHLLFCLKTSNKSKSVTTPFHTTTTSFGAASIPSTVALHNAPLDVAIRRKKLQHPMMHRIPEVARGADTMHSFHNVNVQTVQEDAQHTMHHIHTLRSTGKKRRVRVWLDREDKKEYPNSVHFSGKGKLRSYSLANQRPYTVFEPNRTQGQYPSRPLYAPTSSMVAKQGKHLKGAAVLKPLHRTCIVGVGERSEANTSLQKTTLGSKPKMHKRCNQQSIPFLSPLYQKDIKGQSKASAHVAKTWTNKKAFTTLFCSFYLSWYATKADLESLESSLFSYTQRQERSTYTFDKPIFQESTLPLLAESDQVTFGNSKVGKSVCWTSFGSASSALQALATQRFASSMHSAQQKENAKGYKKTFFFKKFDIFPGQFLNYGDNINDSQNIVTTESGQVLYIDSEKATLRKAQTVLIYSQAIIAVFSEEWIKKGAPLMSLSYQKLVTGDIVQGLPKIEQFFEAPVLKDGTFWSGSLQAKLNQFFQEYKEGKDSCEARPLAEAVRKGFSEIQRVLVEGVQRVYISQGVLIADKHLEVIVRQMTCKGRILYSGDTGFLRNELVSLDKIENVNQVIYGQKALYHPQVRGITDASLESESFLSAASFQETTRVLSRDAIIGKTDLMRGLKERVIVGELIQAGTGLATNGVYSLV